MKVVAFALASLLGLSTVAFADEAPYAGPPGGQMDQAPGPEAGQALGQPADYRQPQGPMRRGPGMRGPRRGNPAMHAAIVAQFDRDGDGRLSPQERRHAARALRRMARQLARADRRQGRQGMGQGQPGVDVDVRWQR